MSLPDTLNNFTVHVDGFGWAGKVEEGNPPKLSSKMEEFEGGGMTGPVDIDMGSIEKLESEITFAEFNPSLYALFGQPDKQFTFRGAKNGTSDPVMYQMRGTLRELDPGSWKKGDKGQLKVSASFTYMKVTVDGKEVIEIDQINMIYKVDGKDMLAEQRKALGL